MNERSLLVLDSLRSRNGFNHMNPSSIADELSKFQDYMNDVFWSPSKDDTIIIFYRTEMMNVHRSVYTIRDIGSRMGADEIDVLEIDEIRRLLNSNLREPLPDEEVQLFEEMVIDNDYDRAIRLWWD